jgi:signal transduction histidine kinase
MNNSPGVNETSRQVRDIALIAPDGSRVMAATLNEDQRNIKSNGMNHPATHTALLSGLADKIVSGMSEELIYKSVFQALLSIVDGNELCLTVYNNGSGNCIFIAKDQGVSPEKINSFNKEADPINWCMEHKQELLMNDAADGYRQYFAMPVQSSRGNVVASLFCCPLTGRDICIGVACVTSSAKDAFNSGCMQAVREVFLFITLAMEYAKMNAELQASKQHLIQSEKMASLGQLTAGIAHEINNPVSFIAGGIDALKQNYQDIKEILTEYMALDAEADNREKLKEIQQKQKKFDINSIFEEIEQLYFSVKNGALRTTEIVKGLRNFSRLDEDVLKKANIEDCIDSTLIILRSQMKERIEVIKDYAGVPEIFCYPGQLNQVFINILNNAAQAIDGPGKIWIATSVTGGMISIRIKDSGKGISPHVKDRIFDAFFTTKEVGVGTGLGLSITYGIIEKHKGQIKVESPGGGGAEFTILIPVNLLEEQE